MTTETGQGSAPTEERSFTIPPDIPALPLRDTVLFPNSFMPLAVARESSVRLIDDAIAGGKVIGVFTQSVIAVGFRLHGDMRINLGNC
jgi:ATP-dependent Lon protease